MSKEKLGQDPVYPCRISGRYADIKIEHTGMSQRLLIAKDALCAILQSNNPSMMLLNDSQKAIYAFLMADHLLAEEQQDSQLESTPH